MISRGINRARHNITILWSSISLIIQSYDHNVIKHIILVIPLSKVQARFKSSQSFAKVRKKLWLAFYQQGGGETSGLQQENPENHFQIKQTGKRINYHFY